MEPSEPRERPPGLVDAGDFLAFTEQLREVRERLDGARISAEQRSRWQRRLISITDVGARDLERARSQLRRFVADLDRAL